MQFRHHPGVLDPQSWGRRFRWSRRGEGDGGKQRQESPAKKRWRSTGERPRGAQLAFTEGRGWTPSPLGDIGLWRPNTIKPGSLICDLPTIGGEPLSA